MSEQLQEVHDAIDGISDWLLEWQRPEPEASAPAEGPERDCPCCAGSGQVASDAEFGWFAEPPEV